MSREAADPTLGIAAYLATELEVVTGSIREGLRVFRPQLPESEEPNMPRRCVVVDTAGGPPMLGRVNLPIIDTHIDCLCYGSTRLEASNLSREVQLALKELRQSVWERVQLRWARISAAPKAAIDSTETNWPYALVVTQVLYAIQPVAPKVGGHLEDRFLGVNKRDPAHGGPTPPVAAPRGRHGRVGRQ